MSRAISHLVGDVILTWDEVEGLAADLLVVGTPPTGETELADWLEQHSDTVGGEYHSELQRHFR